MKLKKDTPQNFEQSAVILLASAIIVKVIGALFKIPLQRLIGTLGFGYFSSAYDLYLPIYALSMAGLPVAVSRMIASCVADKRYKEAEKTFKIAKKAFLFTGIVGLLVILGAIYPFTKVTSNNPTDAKYIAVCIAAIAPAILFCCILSSFRGYFEGMRNMVPTAVSEVIEALSKLVLGFAFAFVIMKLTGNVAYAAAGALLGIMIGTALAALYLWLRLKIKGRAVTENEIAASPESRDGKFILKCLLAIAIPVVLSSLATNITLLIDTTMIKWQLKNIMDNSFGVIAEMYKNSIADHNLNSVTELTAATMPTFLYGIRGQAYTIYNLIPTLTTTLGIGAIPILTTAWVEKNTLSIKSNIEKILRTTALIAAPAGIGVCAISPYIMGLLYDGTASVEIGSVLLFILGIAALFSGVSVPITSMLQAMGKPVIPLVNIIVGAILKIITNFILVSRPEINIKGAPVGTAVCYMYICVANMICLKVISGVKINFFATLVKPLISALFCGVGAFFTSRYIASLGSSNVIIVGGSILVAAIIYVAFIFILRTLNAEDVASFPKGEKIAKLLVKLHLIK